MLLYVLEDLLQWLEWHPDQFGITWTDYLVGLALVIPFLWMARKILVEVIKVNARIREHDVRTAKNIEIMQQLNVEQDGDTSEERKKDK